VVRENNKKDEIKGSDSKRSAGAVKEYIKWRCLYITDVQSCNQDRLF
jgi:hypothetical protein